MKVRDFMITDVISVNKETSIRELLELLVKHKIGGVPVVDANNRLRGIISDGDIIRYLQPKGRSVYDMFSLVLVSEKEDLNHKIENSINQLAKNIMKDKDIHTVHPDDDLEEILNIFSKYHFKKIPVIDEDFKVVGVISRGDIIRFISTNLINKADG
ncbi:CBS domain-containing protein [Virgibacillus doumboii]|uniref:CBS domain-containing protein n=1 Tax=Virgibacillus doumboii TaxID=2697503 RepID=UPI0013E09406|nr:CBS domain-containing protein [Virgibacillus doumboii]